MKSIADAFEEWLKSRNVGDDVCVNGVCKARFEVWPVTKVTTAYIYTGDAKWRRDNGKYVGDWPRGDLRGRPCLYYPTDQYRHWEFYQKATVITATTRWNDVPYDKLSRIIEILAEVDEEKP